MDTTSMLKAPSLILGKNEQVMLGKMMHFALSFTVRNAWGAK